MLVGTMVVLSDFQSERVRSLSLNLCAQMYILAALWEKKAQGKGHHNIVSHPLGKMNINRKYHSFSLDINFSFSLLEFVSDDGTRAKVRELPKSLKIILYLGTMSVHAKSKSNGFMSCQKLLFWIKGFSYDTDINMLLFIHTLNQLWLDNLFWKARMLASTQI